MAPAQKFQREPRMPPDTIALWGCKRRLEVEMWTHGEVGMSEINQRFLGKLIVLSKADRWKKQFGLKSILSNCESSSFPPQT
jgi:hypothetical protein